MILRNDKLAHTGISAMLVAMLSIVLMLQEASPWWGYLFYSLMVAVVVFIFGLFKEYVVDDKPDKGDIVANAIGCILIPVAVLMGTLLSIWSH